MIVICFLLMMAQMSPSSSTSPASFLIELLCRWPLVVGSIAGGEVCFVTLKTNWPKKSFVAFSDFHNSIEFQINSIDAPPVRYNPQGQGLQAPYTPQVPLTPAPPAARAHIL